MSKKCRVNSDGSVCLEHILDSFNSAIREEHAWALCYQCAKHFAERLAAGRCRVATDVRHVFLQTDGAVHEATGERPARSEREAVAGLGVVIYVALDQGSRTDEERVISQDLEQLISDMVADEWCQEGADPSSSDPTHHETDDEGIERDSEEAEEGPSRAPAPHVTLQEVMRRCEGHLGALTRAQAEAHYRAVVRALVAEALELATFLERVAQGSLPLTPSRQADLERLEFSDWARFWVQVMGELRTGVKLKKVHPNRAPIEYELTPYEILMKDIRSCRYNLRKIMVNGDVPSRVTKDAHAIILEFIRSRPPLKKVTDRKLPPQLRSLTPREQLLNSIKKGRKLRPTPRSHAHAPTEPKHAATKEDACSASSTSTAPGRRLIKVDFSQFEDDDDGDDAAASSPDSAAEPALWPSDALDAYDLATSPDYAAGSRRRHTLEVCDAGVRSVPQSRPCSRQSCNSSEAEGLEPEAARAIQEQLTGAAAWQEAMSLDDRLSLTLAEIVHIRAVLTKAELEALPVEGRVRHDVEARKVCFLCLKTRFGIFGPWGRRCALCRRTVCSRCCGRMSVPMEHFSSVPVVLLSPSIMCTPETESPVSSAGHSPDAGRPGSSMEGSTVSDPGSLGRLRGRARFRANEMVVCHDCRMMVLQIIKAARANRAAIRNKTLQSLTLNLSPVF